MNDFENTPAHKKGAIGEKIVKGILESWGAYVTRPDNSEKSLVDFHAAQKIGTTSFERYVEVKVRSVMNYAYGQYPCYLFPVAQIEAYEKFAAEKNSHVELWIVDSEIGEVIVGSLDKNKNYGLERKRRIDGKKFPFDKDTQYGARRFFHRQQFGLLCSIDPTDLARLRAIKISDNEITVPNECDENSPPVSEKNIANENQPEVNQEIQLDGVKVLEKGDIEDIVARADLFVKTFNKPRKDALQASVKLKAQEMGRDLTPLLELLEK